MTRSSSKRSSQAARKAAGKPPSDALAAADIIAVTLAMARKVGFARLSMRQIATELEVTATALYYHFHDKHELLDGVAAHIMDSIELPDSRLPWRERLRELVVIQQRTMLAYPGLARFLLNHRESAGALRWVETILEVLHDAGFRRQHAMRALATLSFFVHPLTLLDDRPHPGPNPMMHPKKIEKRIRVEPLRYPHLTELLPQLVDFSFDTYLPIALEGLITGLAAELEEATTRRKKRIADRG